MKKHIWFSMLVLLSLFLLSTVSPAEAVPPLPSSFYGSAKVNGANIPEGAILKAVIGDKEYALTVVENYGVVSVYSLDVPGDDAVTVDVIEGGAFGDTIQFMLGDTPANETGAWVSGTNLELNLTFDIPAPPVMAASYYGTVKINGENAPAGTIIKGIINNVIYATCTVSLFGGNAVYALNIPGDDPGTPGSIEGGVNGNSVQFFIGDLLADQTSIWASETNTEINLTGLAPKEEFIYYLPIFNN